ncbi:hypothetical protein AAFF_G00305720 [Aldrovandia affinis]|uniref:Uncharacterized protein n=1 Tax=Aldrovandia affinis TaxID=143900 RepID=A0AAD7SRB5_9TELE|nr:hypothetical protein AAFF_G00305720 [Aldrovandia affinis]
MVSNHSPGAGSKAWLTPKLLVSSLETRDLEADQVGSGARPSGRALEMRHDNIRRGHTISRCNLANNPWIE